MQKNVVSATASDLSEDIQLFLEEQIQECKHQYKQIQRQLYALCAGYFGEKLTLSRDTCCKLHLELG